MEMQTDGQQLLLDHGVLDLGNQRIAELAELYTRGIPTSPIPPLSLSPSSLRIRKGAFASTTNPLFNPGRIATFPTEADPAGVNLVDFVIIQTGLL